MGPVRMLSFLMLIFSLCDADSTCTTELKALTLDPPEIIAEYGGNPVIVNCSTTSDDHYGIYWRVGNESSDIGEDFFIIHSVPLSEWDVKAECKVMPSESRECSKDLKVIVYKNPEVVLSAQRVNVMGEETQYRLQCDIINVAPVQHLTVSWYKNNESIKTQSFNDTTKTPVNESSVLRVNISREENEVQFRCEAQLDFGPDVPQLPVISQTHSVSAHYAPELNTKNNPHDISTLEGTNITLSCEAEGNPPPVYHWTCDGVNQLENTNSLSITRVNHNVTCTCTATNDLGNITKTIHVHVKERGCPLTLTPSEIVVRFGDPVSINCSTSATYVVGMGWEAPFGGTGFEPPPAVTWRVEKVEEWTPSPFCYATLDDNSQCSMSPVIIVYKSPDIVSISSLDQSEMTEDHVYRLDYNKHARTQYRLQCDIINVAPVQHLTVSWYKNNESIMTQSFNDTTKTPVNESSVLRVNISREENEVQFRCEAHLDFGSYGPQLLVISQTHNVSVDYAPELNTINNPHDISTLEGTNITLSCEAEGNPPPVYHWTCDGVNQLENTNSLSITRVNHNVTCTCTATNDLGNITKTIHVHVKERGCPLTLTPSEIVVRFGDPVSINCSTSATYVVGMGWEAPFGGTGFEPPPAVTWRVKKVEEWTPSPSCSATLDDNSQCFVRPVINVYKGPDTLSISELDHSLIMEATAYKQYTRTQHRLKCDIINVAPVQHLTVSWYKNNESIMTQSFNDTTTTPVNESSVLGVTISREENEVQFRCEAQLDFGPDGPQLPVIFQTYSISAHYAPELNTKNNPHDISTLEGTNITLSCEAEGNPPPVYHWTCDGVNQLENTNSLSITRVNHNVTCTCTATNDLGNITKTIHVHVKERGCPLTLTPSEIVVRFGDPVSINCSTSATYVVGMGWEAPFGGTGFEPPPAVTWSTEKVEEWTPSPSCYATLDDNSQCFVRPVITVYKGPDTVSIPELDHSLIVEARAYKQYTRTQHRLQCDIINVAPVQHLTVSWYKNNESIMTQSFNDTTKTPINESSVLRVTISREENEVQFRCEAQLDFGSYGPKLPVIFQTYSISAHYAPELNTKNNPHDISTLEGTNITLSCEAEGNPPPVYHWTCDGVNQLENTNSLSITRVNHNVTCTCTATNDLGNITKTIHVHVKERGCPLILTPSEIVVRFGDPVSINCSTSATYVVGMGWEAPFGGTGFEPPPAVTWRVKKVEEWTPSPSCYATLDDNSQCSMSPVITVYKPPDSVSVSAVDHSSILEGREYHLKCDINNVAPVQNLTVKWYKGKETAFTQKFDEFRVTPVNKSSSLRFTAQRDHNGSVFRCEAELQLGPKGPELSPSLISAPYTAVVLYAPEFKEGNDSKEVLLGENVTLSCSADSNPPAIIEWIYAAAGNSKETTEGRQRTVTITRATFINAGVYICVGENKFGRKARSVTLVVKGKTSYIPFPAIWVSLTVLLIILFLLVCLCHKRRNARGHYSFVPVRGPDIPLTTAQANGKA